MDLPRVHIRQPKWQRQLRHVRGSATAADTAPRASSRTLAVDVRSLHGG